MTFFSPCPILKIQAVAAAKYIGKEDLLIDRINAIALLYLLKQDTKHLETLQDYIEEFDFIVQNVKGIDENLKALQNEMEH